MTNMSYVHTITVSRMDVVTPLVLLVCGELAQLAGDMICGTGVRIPLSVNPIGCEVGGLLIIIIKVGTVLIAC